MRLKVKNRPVTIYKAVSYCSVYVSALFWLNILGVNFVYELFESIQRFDLCNNSPIFQITAYLWQVCRFEKLRDLYIEDFCNLPQAG